MSDPTPAEIEAGAQAFAGHFVVSVQAHHRDAAEQVLRAVLPDHDARVRGEERARVAAAARAWARANHLREHVTADLLAELDAAPAAHLTRSTP